MLHELKTRVLGVATRTGDTEQRTRNSEQPPDLLKLIFASLQKLRVGVARLRQFVRLEPAREHRRLLRVGDAAMLAVPLARQRLAGLSVELPIGRKNKPGAGTGRKKASPVQLASPGECDSVFAFLYDRHTVDAVVRRAANVENLLLGVDRLLPLFLAILVPQAAVLDPLNLHPAGMQRHDLIDRTRRAGLQLRERVAPEPDVEHRLLSPLKRGLPCVRLLVQLPVQRQFAGLPLAALGEPLEHVQRQPGDRLAQDPQTRKHRSHLQRVARVDPHAGRGPRAALVP